MGALNIADVVKTPRHGPLHLFVPRDVPHRLTESSEGCREERWRGRPHPVEGLQVEALDWMY